ncbi:MAG: YicC/YloC family endoribonuclease [Nitrospirales bacterium]|nr:YicC family protein [Nitrospirales bacterium]
MTGFGKRESLCQDTMVGVEVRAVNHRFCEISVRLPKLVSDMELSLKELVKQICARGRVDVTVTLNGTGSPSRMVKIDRVVARRYYQALQSLQKEFHLDGAIDVNLLAGFRDIFSSNEETLSVEGLSKMILGLTRHALQDLEKMRQKEGAALKRDLAARIQVMVARVEEIESQVPSVVEGYAKRLEARVTRLLSGESVNSDRIAQEAVLFAEKSDVTEEVTRLSSHFTQFRSALKAKEAVGKRLDFLLQEMGREVNTIGSKANDANISKHVVELKSELEKVREQVQNVE